MKQIKDIPKSKRLLHLAKFYTWERGKLIKKLQPNSIRDFIHQLRNGKFIKIHQNK